MTITGSVASRESLRNSRRKVTLVPPGRSRSSTTRSGSVLLSCLDGFLRHSNASFAVRRTSMPGRGASESGPRFSQARARASQNSSASPGLSSRRRSLIAFADPEAGSDASTLFGWDLFTGPYAWQETEGLGRKASRPPRHPVTGWHTRDRTIQFHELFLKCAPPSRSRLSLRLNMGSLMRSLAR